MATQLKASDYQHIFVPAKPAQHIRVAFVDSKAQRAVTAAVSKLPPSLQQATLDDLATAPFRTMLVRRNAILELLNDTSIDWDDESAKPQLSAINKIENAISARRAATADDAVMKLIAVAQIGAEGHEVDDVEAARAIADARRHFGVGYVHEGLRDQADYTAEVEQTVDVGQRATEWHRLYRAYITSLEAMRSYERDVYIPADPEMDHPIHVEYDRLVHEEFLAAMRILKTPAPGAAELAFKLKLLQADSWMYNQFEEVTEQISADARFVARHGGVAGLDAPLLSAYADCRRGMSDLMSSTSNQASEAAQDRIDVGEAYLVDNQADTIEAVIAKLRVAFRSLVGESWSDEAVINPNTPAFRQGLLLADMYQQLLWRGIEDLARIAGVSLSEQGA